MNRHVRRLAFIMLMAALCAGTFVACMAAAELFRISTTRLMPPQK